MNTRQRSVSVVQAMQETPMLAKLSALTRDSVARLKAVEFLIPEALRASVTAGPIDDAKDGLVWCLILNNAAAAAKFRQLTPAMEAHLRTKGWQLNSIRLKVQIAPRR